MTATRPFPNLGTQQSPIDLSDAFDTDDLRLQIKWKALNLTPIADDFSPTRKLGASAVDPKGHILVDKQRYVPIDLHWHFPAEHTIGGEKAARAEVHIVHIHHKDLHIARRAKSSVLDWARLAVLGVLIKAHRNNGYPAMDLDVPRDKKGAPKKDKGDTVTISRDDLLPATSRAIRYDGSLTTPPYSENVTFFIFDTPLTATSAQLVSGKDFPNARALQDINRRCCVRGHVIRK